jgi:hypothetical protein
MCNNWPPVGVRTNDPPGLPIILQIKLLALNPRVGTLLRAILPYPSGISPLLSSGILS